jgi:general secretion pathway protein M
LCGSAWLFAAVLLWTVALRPALLTVQNAGQQLPALLAQASELDAIILEARALGHGRSGAMSPGETEAALQASLRNAGLAALSVLSRPDSAASGETRWRIQFTNAPAGRVLEWVASLPFVTQVRTRRLDLARSTVDGRDRPGQLSGSIVLALTTETAS